MLSANETKKHGLAHIRREITKGGGTKGITKEKLAQIAKTAGVTVTPAEGKKEATKEDHLRALGF